MAEEGSVYELEGLEKQLQSLLSRYTNDELRIDSKPFCSDFCKLVEEYASRWQVPLPQLRILELALRYFARASTFFTLNCDHVLHTLSSLALSVFELLLFFDQKALHQEPLKHFTVTFQECYLALARHQNVHLLQVERLVQVGGPWACPALQAILSESSLPQSEVDECVSSEPAVFFELRVRYLLSCERVSEAMALAKCCAWHPTTGQHLFFLQVYLTWLSKTSQHDRLQKEVADFNGKDAIDIICILECEETDEILLALSRAFLSQQLCRGDMYYLCELVFVWSKLHSRLKTSKQALLEESRQLMRSATNVNSIFPFIRAILQEVGEDGIQFCVELCANALESCLPCDVITKSLIYKTIAGLLPNDLEVCRACALLVFFLERTVEAYKMVYLLYMHPDQEYHVEYSPIKNHVRFETLQVLKKDLYFDPEFWNLIALRTNCLKLMSEKVVSAALEEIMEDKWILNYCTKEPAVLSSTPVCPKGRTGVLQAATKRRHHKEDPDTASKKLKVGPGKTRLNVDHTVKRKGNQGSRPFKDASSEPLRRSFWQLDRLQDNGGYGEFRRMTRLSEKNPPKRRIRKPKWLMEDSGTLEENNVPPKIKKHGQKHQKHHQPSVEKRPDVGQIKSNAKHKSSVNSHFLAKENSKQQRGFSTECAQSVPPPQVILELSLPDNELMGTFIEDTCNRQRGVPQVLLYKPTVKHPATPQTVKTVHGKEVILRARDAAMFLQQLHCYARRQKGKGNGSNIQSSVSTITRSSAQGSPPKDKHKQRCQNPASENKGGIAVQTPASADVTESPVLEEDLQVKSTKALSRMTSSARELSEKSAVEMKVTVASQTPAAAKAALSPGFEKVPQAQVLQTKTVEPAEKFAAETKVAIPSQAYEVTEAPVLGKVLQTQKRELCDESAVEMKVTFASQTPTAGKGTQSPSLEKVSKTIKDTSKTATSTEVSRISTPDSSQTVTEEILPASNFASISNIGGGDPTPSQPLISQAETGSHQVLSTVCSSISKVDISPSEGHQPCEIDRSPGGTVVTTYKSTDQGNKNDISALTLVTEMVTELAPETLAYKRPAPEDSVSKESIADIKPKVPHKLKTSSSCSVPELGASAIADVQGKKEYSQDFSPETPENSEPVESEESKLEYCCTFCNKVFKGSRVVAHAMFHYRKDECMFCGTMFKDDLLAMMHLSDHIEKLKRSKESAGNSTQENRVSETKDICTPKTSAKAKTTNMSSGCRSSGRPRKSAVCSKSLSLPDSTTSGSRKLRSSDKPVDSPPLEEKKQSASKHLSSKSPVPKVNGHIGKKKEIETLKKDTLILEVKQQHTQQELSLETRSDGAVNPRLQENQDMELDSATSDQVEKDFSCSTDNKIEETESLQVLKTASKHNGKVVEEKNVQLQEKVCCPVDGCAWFTDLSKNRVALLYHALEDHYGVVKPLELAFRIGNSRCSICMRVLWSFKHFQHHVERHRLTPRHPCPHQGCPARFKTGMEMRRHARRHSPLQAVCCLPGCSQLFICLWALNLHEREHYASKSTKPDKRTNEHTGDKHNRLAERKPTDQRPKDETATAAVNKTLSIKATHKSRGQPTHNSTGKLVRAASPTTVRASLLKQEKHSHVLKNLSNKNTSAQRAGPKLRSRQMLRKVKETGTMLASLKSHKVISSSLLKHNINVRHRLRKKQVKLNTKGLKRRGRPPKSKQAVHDENSRSETDQRSATQVAGSSKAAETSTVGKELKEDKSQQDQDCVKTAETKSKKSVNKQINKNHLKQKHNTSTSVVTANILNQPVTPAAADQTQKKKLHKVKKHPAPKENCGQTVSSDSGKAKKHKITNGNTHTKLKKKCPQNVKEAESPSKKLNDVVSQVEAKAAAAAAAAAAEYLEDEEEKEKAENSDTNTQNCSGNSAPAVSSNSLNEITAAPNTSGQMRQKVTKEEKSKKSNFMKKEEKKEKTQTASPDSGKTNKKHRDVNTKGDKKLVKDKSKKTSAATQSKPVDQQIEAEAAAAALQGSRDVEGKSEEETSDTALNSSEVSITAVCLNEKTSPTTATEQNVPKATETKKTIKTHVPKNPDPSKAKRKVVHKEGEIKTVKKKRKDPSVSSVSAKSKTEAQPLTEVKAVGAESSVGEDGKPLAATPQFTSIDDPGYCVKTNEKATDDVKSSVCNEALSEYRKRPYMRLPPTAYLDEKYITMPKRRKMAIFPLSQRSPSPEQAKVSTALQRQRCTNCFVTFNSVEDLQSHLELQKCSNLFGFDSDDEGNS